MLFSVIWSKLFNNLPLCFPLCERDATGVFFQFIYCLPSLFLSEVGEITKPSKVSKERILSIKLANIAGGKTDQLLYLQGFL